MFDASLTESIGWALLHFIWQGTLIGASTALALRFIAPANVRYTVACVALMCMLLAPLSSMVADGAADSSVGSVGATSLSSSASDALSIGGWNANRVLPVAVLWWIAGVLLLSLRLVMGSVNATRLTRATRDVEKAVSVRVGRLAERLGVSRSIGVFESALVESPTVIGWLRPVILLPTSALTAIPVSHLDAIIVHELAHVRRHDYLVNVLQAIVETVLFYHPAVWWCSHQIRVEREHCCDDLVVDICGDRIAYAKALASLEEQRALTPVLMLNASGARLVDRIRRLLNPKPIADARSTAWTTAVVVALLIAVVAAIPAVRFGDVAIWAQESPSQVPRAPTPPHLPKPPVSPTIPAGAVPSAPALPALPFPALPAPPEPPLPPAPLAELEAQAHALSLGAARADDELYRRIEEALHQLALETGGLAVISPPTPPRPPAAAPASPLVPAAPIAPAPPAGPAPPAAPRLPVAPDAIPAPPAPPQGPLTAPSDQQVDAIRDMADRLSQAAQMLLRQSGELRRAEQQLQLRRMELMAKEKELATLRDRTLEQQEALKAMQRDLAESYAKAEAFRAIEPDANRLREQVEALRKQIESLRAR